MRSTDYRLRSSLELSTRRKVPYWSRSLSQTVLFGASSVKIGKWFHRASILSQLSIWWGNIWRGWEQENSDSSKVINTLLTLTDNEVDHAVGLANATSHRLSAKASFLLKTKTGLFFLFSPMKAFKLYIAALLHMNFWLSSHLLLRDRPAESFRYPGYLGWTRNDPCKEARCGDAH